MKVAVLFTGQIRSADIIAQNIKKIRDMPWEKDIIAMAYDYEPQEHLDVLESVDELIIVKNPPDIGYDPYKDSPYAFDMMKHNKGFTLKYHDEDPGNITRHREQTKVIMIQNEWMKNNGHKYDVIVRSRFDIIFSDSVDYYPYVMETYKTGNTVSISYKDWVKGEEEAVFGDGHKITNRRVETRIRHWFMPDNGFIIHTPKSWDTDRIDYLHISKTLLPAEYGWWQIFGAGYPAPIFYDGPVGIARTMKKFVKRGMI